MKDKNREVCKGCLAVCDTILPSIKADNKTIDCPCSDCLFKAVCRDICDLLDKYIYIHTLTGREPIINYKYISTGMRLFNK